MTANAPLLSIRNLRVSFRVDKHHQFAAVKGISFDVAANQTVALVGESGSGKSVTSLAIMRLLPPDSTLIDPASEIIFNGEDIGRCSDAEMRRLRGAEIAMVFQEPMSSLNPVFTVGEQLSEVLRQHKGMDRKAALAKALALFVEVGLPNPDEKLHQYPHELSGGQQQRVMIAMAMACEPKLLIADEPTTALDVTIQRQILELLAALQKKHGMSVLFISHDLALVGEIADRVVVMRHGEIREQGEVEQIFNAPQDTYTQALLACRPPLDHRPRRLAVIDDFMDGRAHAVQSGERLRGVLPGDPIVMEVKHLSQSFQSRTGLFTKRSFQAVHDVSFTLAKGKTLGLVGESGSGKTTVGLAILGLQQATEGEVRFDGKNLLALSPKEAMTYKRRIQIIFQNPYASLNPRFTVGEILLEPMRIHKIGENDEARRTEVMELLRRVSLPPESFYKYPHEFSGGQRQRIAVARALTMKPEVLVCDESVSALDVSVQAQVLNLLQELQDDFGLSYLFISHDLAVVKYISDQVMVMQNGRVVEFANSDEIYHNPQHEYTRKLLAAVPRGLAAR